MERADLIKIAESTGCAVTRGGFVFLCDPKWDKAEREQFEILAAQADEMKKPRNGWLCISTGGTSGKLKFARHDEQTLTAAARGFCQHFKVKRVNAVDVLPAHHTSSFMARMRCAEAGGTHMPWAWKDLENGNYPELKKRKGPWVLSLVPTQLHRLLRGGERALIWLHQFELILIGGGPVWPSLAEGASKARLPLILSYGMTESASMVVAQRKGDFENGDRSSGCLLPHASVDIASVDTGESVMAGEVGFIKIGGENVFRGYFPNARQGDFFETMDLGYWDDHEGLHIIGRRDTVIITGGKKVLPGEVENALRATGVFSDIAVIGVPDNEWGESVVACYPQRRGLTLDMARVKAGLNPLSGYKWPKRYVAVPNWPRNAQGKLNRSTLVAAAVSPLPILAQS